MVTTLTMATHGNSIITINGRLLTVRVKYMKTTGSETRAKVKSTVKKEPLNSLKVPQNIWRYLYSLISSSVHVLFLLQKNLLLALPFCKNTKFVVYLQ